MGSPCTVCPGFPCSVPKAVMASIIVIYYYVRVVPYHPNVGCAHWLRLVRCRSHGRRVCHLSHSFLEEPQVVSSRADTWQADTWQIRGRHRRALGSEPLGTKGKPILRNAIWQAGVTVGPMPVLTQPFRSAGPRIRFAHHRGSIIVVTGGAAFVIRFAPSAPILISIQPCGARACAEQRRSSKCLPSASRTRTTAAISCRRVVPVWLRCARDKHRC